MPSQPGPYQVEINYTNPVLPHKMRLDLQLVESPVAGADLTTLNAVTRGGVPVGLTSAVNSFVNLIQPFFHTSVDFNDFTLWKFTVGTDERNFIGTASIGLSGTDANAVVPAHYRMFTFRSQNGGTVKVVCLEDVSTQNDKVPYNSLTGAPRTLMDFVISDANWIYARDNSYPIAGLNRSDGQNERLWRKRYR